MESAAWEESAHAVLNSGRGLSLYPDRVIHPDDSVEEHSARPGPGAQSTAQVNTPRQFAVTVRQAGTAEQGRKWIEYGQISPILYLFLYFYLDSDLNTDSVNYVG